MSPSTSHATRAASPVPTRAGRDAAARPRSGRERTLLGLTRALCLLVVTTVASCGAHEGPQEAPHVFKIEGLFAPDGSTLSASVQGSAGTILRTRYAPDDPDVVLSVGPMAATSEALLSVSLRVGGCADRERCADFLIWLDGQPLFRCTQTSAHQSDELLINTAGEIVRRNPSADDASKSPLVVTRIDPDHPELARLPIPDKPGD